MLLGFFSTGEVACDIRHKAGEAVSLATSECHALSSELGDLHMKQPKNASAVRMQGRVEKECFRRGRRKLRGEKLFGEEGAERACRGLL